MSLQAFLHEVDIICSYFLSFMGYLKYLLLCIQRSPLTKEWKFFQNQGFAVRKKKQQSVMQIISMDGDIIKKALKCLIDNLSSCKCT